MKWRQWFWFLSVLQIISLQTQRAYSDDVETKITSLLSQMTLEEKLGQLQQLDGSIEGQFWPEYPDLIRKGLLGSTLNVRKIENTNLLQHVAMDESRLKIPVLFAFDVIHGYDTIFPVPLAEASSWEPALAEQTSGVAAREASAVGLKWTFAPMVDIARDPRWGRIVEGSGEDPYLGAAFAAARVRGFQGTDVADPNHVMACAKHWVGYGAALAGRDYNSTEIPENTLREIYFPPFKAALDAGAGTFMSAFNDLNGVPSSANPFTLTDVLKDQWNFDGFVVSDYRSVFELVNHGLAANPMEAARYGLMAGVDMEMVSTTYAQNIPLLLKNSRVTQARVDDAVRRILRMKFRLGLFDHPYTDAAQAPSPAEKQQFKSLAREAAGRSIVLLKNDRALLPLKKNLKTVAVIGPLADDSQSPLGSWTANGAPNSAVSVLSGIRNALGASAAVNYVRGCDIMGSAVDETAQAVAAASNADVAIMVLGEADGMSGEAASRSEIGLPGKQLDLLKAVVATKTPVVLVLVNGRPLTLEWEAQNIPAIVETWFGGSEAGNAVADVLFGHVNPSGKLPVTFPRSVGQIPLFYNHKNTGRPAADDDKYTSKYLDVATTPLFPFGFGLSYTQFKIFNLKLNQKTVKAGEKLQATVDVANTGSRAGDEVVQLYLRQMAASVTRPVRELKGFQKVRLKPGETKTLSFQLSYEDLGFYNRQMVFVTEPGTFLIYAGDSSEGGIQSQFEAL